LTGKEAGTPMQRVALFVDGGNMFFAQRYNGWQVDFRLVYQYFMDNREKAGAFYFTATPPAGDRDKVEKYRKFRTALIYIGYTVVDKEVSVITDRVTGLTKLKGNLDVEMVFRMLSTVDSYDEAVVMGGDRDYVPIFEHLRNLGKTVTVVGRRASTATEVINVANRFIDMETIRDRIEKRGGFKPRPSLATPPAP
jgi:uncharacterized LabA/DUF88 family protein